MVKKLTKTAAGKMTPQEATAACNELGLPEGTGEEMRQALIDSLEPDEDPED